MYRAELSIEDGNTSIPFLMDIKVVDDHYSATIINGEERIEINEVERKEDSLIFKLPVFPSVIKTVITENGLSGNWYNYNKENHSIPFTAKYDVSPRFDKESTDSKMQYVMGKYLVTFNDDKNEWKAIGQFTQNKQGLVRGTFLTETSDYRYLSGIMDGNQLKLSTFDGAHAFLFTATLENNELTNGRFYSGSDYSATWSAVKADDFSLPDAKSITFLKDSNVPLEFSFDDLKGNIVDFPSEQFDNKVLIVQILGTWCPNCMDETRYLTGLYNEYHDAGLEIIGVSFEGGIDEEKIIKSIDKFKKDLAVPYPIYYGGLARKDIASEAFPQLNKIMSFPTSIIIDRSGTVQRIHSGFSGPGTGKVFDEYSKETELFLSKLLRNKI